MIHIAILIAMVAASWILPRTYGLLGLLAAHVCGIIGLIAMGGVSLMSGVGPAYEPIELFGYIIQGVIYNFVMLPLSIWALLRWRRLSPMSRLYDPRIESCGPTLRGMEDGG